MREYEKRRHAAETAQQQEARLARRRLRDRARRAAQSAAEAREVGLQRLSIRQQQRLVSETQEPRATRLLQASYNQQQRFASETQEERAACLLQASAFSNRVLHYASAPTNTGNVTSTPWSMHWICPPSPSLIVQQTSTGTAYLP